MDRDRVKQRERNILSGAAQKFFWKMAHLRNDPKEEQTRPRESRRFRRKVERDDVGWVYAESDGKKSHRDIQA